MGVVWAGLRQVEEYEFMLVFRQQPDTRAVDSKESGTGVRNRPERLDHVTTA